VPRYVPEVVTESTAVSPITLPPAPPPPPVAQSAVAPDPPPPIIPPRFNADYLQNPAPAYPALARRLREQGRVLIRVLVSVDGMPEQIELKTSSGFPRLDHSALETIRSWKFVPARQGEQKIAAWVVVPIAFTLEG
jgi:protein TonB